MGGGSVELYTYQVISKNVFCYDIFPPLVSFWKSLFNSNSELKTMVKEMYPLTKDRFYETQKSTELGQNEVRKGAEFYVLNRCSFSGSTLSGGISPNHPRFTERGIERLSLYSSLNIPVDEKDFSESIPLHASAFMYLDPPYKIVNENLYGHRGSTHKGFDHERLLSLLKGRTNWLLSYNDSPEIRDMYSGHEIISLEWAYGMTKNRKSKEVLIFSKDLKSDL
jgi:DNA adenine methylase